MQWKDYAHQIREVLGLRENAVAITYSMKPPSTWVDGKYRVCDAFLRARDGEVIDLTSSTSASWITRKFNQGSYIEGFAMSRDLLLHGWVCHRLTPVLLE